MENKKKTKWPVYLTLVIAVYMLAMISLAVFTFTQSVELVEGDYYQKEVAYSKQIERIKSSKSLPKQPSFTQQAEPEFLILDFPASFDRTTLNGKVMFYRPSDSSLDWTMPLALDANYQQRFPRAKFADGYWKIKLNWSGGKQEYYHEQSLMIEGNK
ncbi:MAG: hypothetical protein DWQ10_03770 [Calditrichaeota bacterium]|nr:MAG: hypothetical protein DWQ10_03770 [Calditrichota bacterium]